ncbi:hypothetical protein BW13_11040 [Bifidobacterium sp. UTCIF-37]|uniref:hypothetical protein n=1 Tax=unclassified Bifidobacterium TaxID=2608897 RepID=UPI00112E18ED|nr:MULTISPECIES: hypothetical protein [unclassified Bifidobacterium]TPF85415.1 hypothetical protein BW13_11040 [Bifidobacterium sp. UTCIF-37]TPF87475.1 hypothetical protein BW11_11120 [Bifidobacterium sp. UTCIF-38]
MTAPEQQPNNPIEPNGGNTAAPGNASDQGTSAAQQPTQTPAQPQPQYGQYANLDYGAMRSQFGPNYNPYLYGAPDPDPKSGNGDGVQQNGQNMQPPQGYPQNAAYNPYGYPGQQGGPYNPYNPNGANPYAGNNPNRPADGHTPRYIYGIDVNDPNQNPLYGRWDSYAIIAFVFALIFSVPLLPAIMGVASLWRTKTFHMKGRGFAIAAIIINVITTGVQVWMWLNGISMNDLYAQLLNAYGLGGGSGSSGDSLSA